MFSFITANKRKTLAGHEENESLMQADEAGKRERLLNHNQRTMTERIGKRVEETGYSIENMISLIEGITKHVEIQMESVGSVVNEINNYSALAEEVYASTSESTRIAEQTLDIAQNGNLSVDNSIKAMADIESSVDNTKEVVNELRSKTGHIDNIIKIIKDISRQTNLLALNASIEAARAGEAGKGFAVVASEIKNLAQKSTESAEKISNIIGEINTSAEETIVAMENSIDKVNEGTQIAHNTAKGFKNIIDAANTNMQVTEEISKAMSHQTNILEHVIGSTDDMHKISETVLSIVESALMNTQFTKSSIKNLAEVSEILKSIGDDYFHSNGGSNAGENESCHAVRTCNNYEVKTYDPAMTYNTLNVRLIANVHAGLLVRDHNSDVLPGVAKNWYTEEDNRNWVFNLRKGIKFHNGREVSAQDVRYSLERLVCPKLKAPNDWFLDMVEGAKEYKAGKALSVSGIKVLDRHRISIRLEAPYNGFLLNLGHCACSIIDSKDAENGIITGCGPYYIERADDKGCVMRAFDDYFGGRAYIDRIEVVHMDSDYVENYANGAYDFIAIQNRDDLEKLKEMGRSRDLKSQVVMNSDYVGFNLKSGSIFAKSRELRHAMNYAVDKKRIIRDIVGNLAVESKGPFPPGIIDNSKLPGFEHNPQRAKDIMRSAGIGRVAEKLKIHYSGNAGSVQDRISEYIAQDLRAIGIESEFVRVRPDELFTPAGIGKCDIYVYGWFADTGDADNYIEPLFSADNYSNLGGYHNTRVQELIQKAKENVNPYKRLEMYNEIQRIIVDDAPWIFLFHRHVGIASRKGILGASVTPLAMVNYENIMLDGNVHAKAEEH